MSRIAVITGASSGIGRSLAFLCARGGYDLHLIAREKDPLMEVKHQIKKEYDTHVTIQAIDLTKLGAPNAIHERTAKLKGDVEILINNAGFGDFAKFTDAKWSKLGDMININVTNLSHLAHLYAQDMVNSHSGRILNVASTAAFLPGPMMAVYHATKAYVLNLSEALAEELKDEGVTVTALCPGPTETNFAQKAGLENTIFFLGKIPGADEVAEFGYNAMMDGKRVAIHGLRNRLQAETPRFAPRKAVSFVANQLYGKRRD